MIEGCSESDVLTVVVAKQDWPGSKEDFERARSEGVIWNNTGRTLVLREVQYGKFQPEEPKKFDVPKGLVFLEHRADYIMTSPPDHITVTTKESSVLRHESRWALSCR